MAHTFRHLIASLFVACSVVYAQAETPVPPVRQVTLQFGASAQLAPVGVGYMPATGKPLTSVDFYDVARSIPQRYTGDAIVKFYDMATVKDDAVPEVVASCEVPEGLRNVLFLFITKAKPVGGIKYDVAVIDDSETKVPYGSFAIINLSGKEYAASYGAEPIMIRPGISGSYSSARKTSLQLAVARGQEWANAGRHEFQLSGSTRGWVIIYPPARATSFYPAVKSLIDMKIPEPVPGQTSSIARYP